MNIDGSVELEIISRLQGNREDEKVWAELHFYRMEREEKEPPVAMIIPANLTSQIPE